jgi:hypothetical protein
MREILFQGQMLRMHGFALEFLNVDCQVITKSDNL